EDRAPDRPERRVLSRGRFTFYRNRGDGSLIDDTERAGLDGGGAWGCGVAAGDIDGDGDLDLYVTCFGPNLLYRNRGDGSFEEVGGGAGVADAGWAGGAAFLDADGDGDLDLYLSNYIDATVEDLLRAERTLHYKGRVEVMVGPFGLPGGRDRFYRNRGDGTFEDATAEAGLTDVGEGYGLGVVASDLDEDGDLDLYVANDSNPNYLFRNRGDGSFEEIGVICGAAFSADGAAQAGMGVEVADLDGDGILDIFVTNFSDDSCAFYQGEGKLFFSDISARLGLAPLTSLPLSWGTASIDFDQDGLLDLVVANGHIYPQVDELGSAHRYRQRCLLLLNRGERFIDGTEAAGPGLAIEGSYRGLAVGDLDGDRDPDLLLTRIDEPALLLRYDGGAPGRWLAVSPRPYPYPRWIGARIDVVSGGRAQSRVILSGGSYATQSSLRALFSLGEEERAELVVVRFPGGGRRVFRDVPGGAELRVGAPQ
ncbi:MAG: FG-GAP repeat domain-containing protein, partial [Planctomycetota bacterium]